MQISTNVPVELITVSQIRLVKIEEEATNVFVKMDFDLIHLPKDAKVSPPLGCLTYRWIDQIAFYEMKIHKKDWSLWNCCFAFHDLLGFFYPFIFLYHHTIHQVRQTLFVIIIKPHTFSIFLYRYRWMSPTIPVVFLLALCQVSQCCWLLFLPMFAGIWRRWKDLPRY